MTVIAILTTTDSRDNANAIAGTLVDRKLAACVQISGIDSVYSWEGEVQESPEYRLLIKTTDERYGEVEATIRDLHTYELPAIIGFRMDHAFAQFADWVAQNSSGGESPQ